MNCASVIDLHCDTLTVYRGGGAVHTMDDPRSVMVLSRLPKGVHWCQCFAIFVPDGMTAEESQAYYRRFQGEFARQVEERSDVAQCRSAADIKACWAQGKTAAILTVENGVALGGELSNIDRMARDGVRMLTITWNGENQLGSGNSTQHGLSELGRAAIPRLEQAGILLDVSHLNDPGFTQMLDVASRPFVASHSNARSVCGHPRNLADWQIREMISRRCLIGLNYCIDFLQEDGKPELEDLLRHIDHFLELGGEDWLALGSDFDGADLPEFLRGPERVVSVYDRLLERGYSRQLCDKLFCQNAMRFFEENLT